MFNLWAEVSLLVEIDFVRIFTAVIILFLFPPDYISHGLRDKYRKARFH